MKYTPNANFWRKFVLSSNAHRIYLKDDFVTQYFIVGKLRLKSILILQNLET